MNLSITPQRDTTRQAEAFVADMLAHVPGYLPGWEPQLGGSSWAVIQIYARYLQALSERLALAPDKNKLAFLDLLGINLLPAQAARAPMVFTAMPHVGDGRIPARTQVGASVAGRDEPLVYETENAIGLAAAQLLEVVTVWPGKDAYADHSTEAMGHQPVTLFEPLQQIPHELYLAHDTLFAMASEATVELQMELASPGSQPLSIVWEYWDSEVWQAFKPFKSPAAATDTDSVDGTQGLTRSGIIRLVADCAETATLKINGVESSWIRGRITEPMPPVSDVQYPLIDRINVRTVLIKPFKAGLTPNVAFNDGLELDLNKSFYPFGQQPQPGSTFYFASEEAFSKVGAQITINATIAHTPLGDAGDAPDVPVLTAEYWDGRRWTLLTDFENLDTFISAGGIRQFEVPAFLTPTTINNVEDFWLRFRIIEGGFTRENVIQWTDPGDEDNDPRTNTITVIETVPPALASLLLRYDYYSPWDQPQWCMTYNDFQWQDHSDDARWRGTTFEPFIPLEDRVPTLYLGFDRSLPADLISLYMDIQEVAGRTRGALLAWEYWNGTTWLSLTVQDETENLVLPGMVSLVWPGTPSHPIAEALTAGKTAVQLANVQQAAQFQAGDQVYIGETDEGELAMVAGIARNIMTLQTPLDQMYERAPIAIAALPRFGRPRTWLRAKLQTDGDPIQSQVNGIYPNAVWASQIQTTENEVLGASTGQANQAFFFRQTPVLDGEIIEVRELSGLRAPVELPILRQELAEQGIGDEDVRTVTDPRTGEITEVWVRWQQRPNLFFSGPNDRHYMLERSRGRLIFGDNVTGRIPSTGADNIRSAMYRSGGGLIGNVSKDAINQLLSGVPVESVTNARAAEGGADGEPITAVHVRGPKVTRHRYQAISLSDYEALAREASPAVAVARALPTTHASGRPRTGWVKLIIMPHSHDPQPQPSFELRRKVQDFLSLRVPASMADQITVTGPTYLPVGVEAQIATIDPTAAGTVMAAATQTLADFLHPLSGGPEGTGWPFGRDVYLSDVAAVLENVSGVDYVKTINLLNNGTPQGEVVQIPPDRIVVAGSLKITLTGSER